MGTGDLLLLHFDKAKDSLPNVSQASNNGNHDSSTNAGALALALGPNEASLSRNGSVSRMPSNSRRTSNPRGVSENRTSLNESAADDEDGSSDLDENSFSESETSNQDLEHIVDSSKISFASQKRNRDFHRIFKKIPSSDRLISEYSCALSKDILVHGKMYLSEKYICFSSNILGWVTHIVIPLPEVIQIEKKSTAVLFPNGMIIRTLHQKYTFATFIARDHTFNEITKVWHGVLDTSDLPKRRSRRGSKRSVEESAMSDAESETDGSASITASDDEEEDGANDASEAKADESNGDRKSDETSKLDAESETEKANDPSSADGEEEGKESKLPNPGPATHAPTKADGVEDRSDVFILDETFKAPLGAVFNILFGSDTSHIIKILESQKNFDLEKDKIKGLSNSKKERNYTYIKPLNGPIGPKQTKCLITEKIVHCDYSLYVHVEQMTQTPDVPSGNLFKIKTKLVFTWAPKNCTKLHVTTSVEWSGKSWIKGAIEKGSIDGQKESMKSLAELLHDIIDAAEGGGSKKKKRRKLKKKSSPVEEKKPEEPAKELSIAEQIQNLASSVGKSLPISIPFVGDVALGGIIMLGTIFVAAWIISLVFSGSKPKGGFHNASDRVVMFGNNEFFVIPDQEMYMRSPKARMLEEAGMWNWIFDRSKGEIPDYSKKARNGYYDQFANQEFEEIVKLTKKRLDDIYEKVNA